MNLVESLLKLDKSKQSGVLRCEGHAYKRQIVARTGRLAFAESNVPDEHLATILIRMGLLKRSHLPGISALMKTGKNSDRAILESTGLSNENMKKAVMEQAVSIMSSLLGREDIKIRFYAGESLVTREIQLDLPLSEILVIAARRAAKEGRPPGVTHWHQLMLIRNPANLKERLNLPLNSHESFALSLIQAPASAEDVLLQIPAGETKPEELLRRLLLLDLLSIDSPRASGGGEKASLPGHDSIQEHLEILLQSFEVSGLYEILSVPTDASNEQIKDAYYKLAKQYHPDRFQSKEHSADLRKTAQKLFTYITGAYATLGDPASRASYDETRNITGSRLKAVIEARAAVEADKEKMADALFSMGRIAFLNGDYDKAVKHLKECVWLCPDVAKYNHHLGSAQAEIPRLRKEAERYFLRALELEFTSVATHISLGKLYLRVNLPRKAEAQFREALRWESDNVEAIRLLEQNTKR
ncbi:MAG: DnaJ-class molecular chaperone with C-terminal Zn finger domain [Acidobacteria bacterium]|nr:DnaJ-class molecular chaperone with C-terminal Zn finger domain [Acidobacteriota bacterium]